MESVSTCQRAHAPLQDLFRLTRSLLCSFSAQLVADLILKRLQLTQLRVIFFSLGLLDILMDQCSLTFHKQVASQEFLKQLVSMLNNQQMNTEVSKGDSPPFWLL